MQKYSKIIISLIILILFFSLWSYSLFRGNVSEQPEVEYERPKINISSLPRKVQDSLENIEKNVEEKMAGVNRFYLNFDRLLSREVITSSSVLVLKVGEAKSQYEPYVVSMPDSFVGLTPDKLKEKLGDWNLEEYNPHNSLVLSREFSDLEQDYPYYLGLEEEQVAVLEKKAGQEDRVLQQTELHVDQLPAGEKEVLRQGIFVESEEELLALLEGLLSYRLD